MRLAHCASHIIHDTTRTCFEANTYFEMANNQRPDDFHIGWICAVQTEYVVACELLDVEYPAQQYLFALYMITIFTRSAVCVNTTS